MLLDLVSSTLSLILSWISEPVLRAIKACLGQLSESEIRDLEKNFCRAFLSGARLLIKLKY